MNELFGYNDFLHQRGCTLGSLPAELYMPYLLHLSRTSGLRHSAISLISQPHFPQLFTVFQLSKKEVQCLINHNSKYLLKNSLFINLLTVCSRP